MIHIIFIRQVDPNHANKMPLTEPLDPFTVGVQHHIIIWPTSLTSACGLSTADLSNVHLYLEWGVNAVQYYNIHLFISVKGQLLLTQAGHVLRWHSQSPEEELLLCFSLNITVMHKHHSHQMWAVDHRVSPIDLNADVPLVPAPIETQASWSVFMSEAPDICALTMDRQSHSDLSSSSW